ncbi:MAG: peptide ABC transporter substrate-binding protein [Clostridiales bacterium]|jgi:peptide/nickel transport system substrate-binding protein|nr:peptide ABC transporter substrate-binding protein [Clostridiales bacterium]
MMKRICAFVFLIIILCSCSSPEPAAPPKEADATLEAAGEDLIQPQPGKSVSISTRPPKTLNPLLNEDITVDRALRLIFDSLARIDEFQKPAPSLAEWFVFSEDGLTLTLKLKDGLVWHDGEGITAYDIEYSINTIKAAGENTIYKKNVTNINSCTVTDYLTVDIVFNSVYGGNSYSLDFPIIPMHYYGGTPDNMHPIGSAAYKFDYFEKDKEIGLVSNTAYPEKPLIDQIIISITPNIDADRTSFEHGIIDAMTSDLVDLGKFRSSKEINITHYNTMYYDFIGFNYKNPVFSDVNIRKAIAHIISKEEIIESVYLGRATPTLMPVNPNSWLYDTDLADFNFNATLSQELIQASGYALDGDGFLSKDIEGTKHSLNFRILVNEENGERSKIAALLQKNLESVNVKGEIIEVPFEEYVQKINNREFDILVGGYNLSIFPDLTFLFETSSTASGTNIFSYSNPEMDSRLAAVRGSRNDTELKANTKALQQFMAQDIPCISLVFRNAALLTDTNIYGEIMPTVNNVFNNIHLWFVYEEE